MWHKLYWARCIRLFKLLSSRTNTNEPMRQLNRQFLHSMALLYIKKIQLLSLNIVCLLSAIAYNVVYNFRRLFFAHVVPSCLVLSSSEAAMIAFFFSVVAFVYFSVSQFSRGSSKNYILCKNWNAKHLSHFITFKLIISKWEKKIATRFSKIRKLCHSSGNENYDFQLRLT